MAGHDTLRVVPAGMQPADGAAPEHMVQPWGVPVHHQRESHGLMAP